MIKKASAKKKIAKKRLKKISKNYKAVTLKKAKRKKVIRKKKINKKKTTIRKTMIQKMNKGSAVKDKKTTSQKKISQKASLGPKKSLHVSRAKAGTSKMEEKIRLSEQKQTKIGFANSHAIAPTVSGLPIPEAIVEMGAVHGGPPSGIPYKNEEYVSKVALNKDAKTAKGLSKPRGTSTHTFTAANHSRRSK